MDPKLVGNYSGIAIATFISGCFFYLLFYKRDRVGKDPPKKTFLSIQELTFRFWYAEEAENAIGKGPRYDSATTLTQDLPLNPDEKSRSGPAPYV